MLFTPSQLLALSAPVFSPDLVSPPQRRLLTSIPDLLPPVAFAGAFECRLEAGAGRVDFEACLSADSGAREVLAQAFTSGGLASASAPESWRPSLRALRAWGDATSPFHDAIQVVWLEFDAAERETPQVEFDFGDDE